MGGQSKGMSTKHSFSFFVLAAALLAPLAACSSASPDGDGTQDANESDIKSGKKKATCESIFGQCVALTPSSCAGGTWADANEFSCGGGLGVGCCVKPTPPPPPPPPPTNACTEAGGSCVGLSPSSCPSGRWGDATKLSCGSGVGVGCCLPECPELAPPAPTFCPNGKITPRKDDTGCIVGYDCVPPPANACEQAGGKCVGLSPSSCPSGHWADYNTHSCGTGLGVGCCLP